MAVTEVKKREGEKKKINLSICWVVSVSGDSSLEKEDFGMCPPAISVPYCHFTSTQVFLFFFKKFKFKFTLFF